MKTGETWFSNKLVNALSELRYPLFFMDFESLNPAIPRFSGMWPYSQIPFQWSVHRQLTDRADLEHFEFLADDESDPRPKFIQSLCDVLGKRGQIVVYNAAFESQRLAELAAWLPEYGARIQNIRGPPVGPVAVRERPRLPSGVSRIVLCEVSSACVGARNDVWGPGSFRRRASRSRLGPDDRGVVDPTERRRLKDALLAYCRQDTLAMLKILERLRRT